MNKSNLLPDIKLRKVKWFIEMIKDENGFIIDNPIEIEVTPSTPYTTNGFSARTYSVTTNRPEERLDVIYKDLSSGDPNLTLISVSAKAVTEIGENISTSTTLSPLCGVGGYTYSQIRDAFYKMLQLRRYKMVELYDLKISRRDKIWFTAFSMYLNGERISDKQLQLIISTNKKSRE